eukprot:COSAG01_NODE_2599_length_7398_cov_3.522263_4_plen_60_part_00
MLAWRTAVMEFKQNEADMDTVEEEGGIKSFANPMESMDDEDEEDPVAEGAVVIVDPSSE